MRADLLHVVTAVANPLGWRSRIRLVHECVSQWVASGAQVTVVECSYGEHQHELSDISGTRYVPVRARTLAWSKECLLNIGISSLPSHAQYIATLDADIVFRNPQWAQETLAALQLYPVVQPWSHCYDLGPNGEHLEVHHSFCRLYHEGRPVVAKGPKIWKFDGGYHDYAHPGFAWAWRREVLDDIGGLFELGAMGSGDHHMALSLVGEANYSLPGSEAKAYRDAVLLWQARAAASINRKLGFVQGTIEHGFHGRKQSRGYVSRWQMFLKHQFDPLVDLKRNTYGVLEFAGNKPDLERAFDRYLRQREEDGNLPG